MTLSEELAWRGFIQDTTLENITDLDKHKWVFYIGFDASAQSQTIGNLASMMAAQVFLRHQQQGIILAGGATTLIGDPGGKNKERDLQSKQTVAGNVAQAQRQCQNVFRQYKDQIQYVNNLDWLADFKLLDFLRDVGKHFSMTPLIQRDYIASRLGASGSGISYTEFSYTLLQGYDYLKLFEDYGCNLQLGGSDQWGNCLSGADLIRRQHQANVHVITLPLIIDKTTGKKFGKSEAGAVWLDPNLTHPSDFYQFWFNVADENVLDYLKVYTALGQIEVEALLDKHQAQASRRLAQTCLADQITSLVHNQAVLKLCQLYQDLSFNPQGHLKTWGSYENIQAILKQTLPAHQIIYNPLKTGQNQADFWPKLWQELIHKTSLESKTQIKTLLKNKALKAVQLEQNQAGALTTKIRVLHDLEADYQAWTNQPPSLLIIGKNMIRSLHPRD